MFSTTAFINRVGEDATLLTRILSWGGGFNPAHFDCAHFACGRDPTTGWPAVTWTAWGGFNGDHFNCDHFACGTTIKIMVRWISSREVDPVSGRVTEERWRIYTLAPMAHLDRIIYHGDTFEIETEPTEHYLRGGMRYRDAVMIKVS